MDEWIGPYRVTNPYLGRGGQAVLVEAEREGKSYVLKLLNNPSDPEATARFEQEIFLLAAVSHTNIVRYVDDGVYGVLRYIALEKLAGYNLRFALADAHSFDPIAVADIGRQVTRALQVFHQLGAVHRDVKPENLQIEMSTGHVWLLDFGYARHVKRTRISNPDGDLPGTDGYRAPEMLQGYAYKQSDFFSLGVVLYELVSGRHPYGGNDPTRAYRVVPTNQLVPDCPKFLVNAIGFLLAWDVRDRPQTAAEVLDILEDPVRGLRVIQKDARGWMGPGNLPVLFRLDAQSVSPLEQAEVNDVRPDAYLGAGIRSPMSAAEARMLAGDILVDPELHLITQSGFEAEQGLAATICSAYGSQPVSLDDMHDSAALRAIAQISFDLQQGLDADVPLVPTFIVRDVAPHGWLGCNAALLDEYANLIPRTDPFGVRVIVSLDAATTAMSRQRLADAIGRHTPDFFLLSFDGLEGNASPEQLLRALEISHVLQSVAPCIVCDATGFAPLWFAFGHGVAFDTVAGAPLRIHRQMWSAPRFEFPSLLTSLRIEDAMRALSDATLPETLCRCFVCRSSETLDHRVAFAPAHNAAMANRERAEAMAVPPSMRRERLSERVAAARAREEMMRLGGWHVRVARLDAIAEVLRRGELRIEAKAA